MVRQDLIKYIRTDKNGTKYYHDYTCPRCAGMGEADKWRFTGLTCFACGGTGVRTIPKTVKEYTDEYWTKLQARRQAKAAKYAEEHADEIAAANDEQTRREAEHRKSENARRFSKFGCGSDGIGFVLTGNTYPVKETIKENGGRWVAMTWVSPVEVTGNGIRAIKINLNEFINEYGVVDEQDAQDIIYCIGQQKMSYSEAKETVSRWNEER